MLLGVQISQISQKQYAIIIVAFAQIIFGLVTLICNENIFNKLLTSVSSSSFILVLQFHVFCFSNWLSKRVQGHFKLGKNLLFLPIQSFISLVCSMEKILKRIMWSQLWKKRGHTLSGRVSIKLYHTYSLILKPD